MATCLLAWELGAGAGHCVNLQPIAEGLLRRGHRVWVAARDLAAARRTFGTLAVEYLQAPYAGGRPAFAVRSPRSFVHILHNTGFADAEQLETLVAAWRNLFQLVGSDVVVCEHAPTALLASRFVDVRRVVLGTGFFSPPDVAPLPDLRSWSPPVAEELARDERVLLERVNRLLEGGGQAPLDRLAQLYSEVDENFLLSFAELDHYARPDATYWGMWSPAEGIEGRWADGPGPRVFAYLKPPTASWNLVDMLAVLHELKLRALVYAPGVEPAWLSRFRSARLQFSTQRLAIQRIAQQCDVAILNGNAGTSTELLLRGVPQLNIPLFLEQMIFSRRVEELGAGLMAEPRRTEQFAVRLMALLQNGRFRAAARGFAERHAGYDPRRAIDEIVARVDGLLPH